MGVNYTPNQNTYKDLGQFRFWCQKVLPLVYDDSLSYYELLCKVVNYLNETIQNVDLMGEDIQKLHDAYVQLQEWVNKYFDNLDVQEEINVKLDNMAKSGDLDVILRPLFNVYEEQIKVLDSRVTALAKLDNEGVEGYSEVVEARVDYTGKEWDSLGEHLRGVSSQFSSEIEDFSEVVLTLHSEIDLAKNVEYSSGKFYENGGGMHTENPAYPMSYVEKYVRILPNTKYKCISDMQICFYDKARAYIGFHSGADSFTTAENCAYIRWSVLTSYLPIKIAQDVVPTEDTIAQKISDSNMGDVSIHIEPIKVTGSGKGWQYVTQRVAIPSNGLYVLKIADSKFSKNGYLKVEEFINGKVYLDSISADGTYMFEVNTTEEYPDSVLIRFQVSEDIIAEQEEYYVNGIFLSYVPHPSISLLTSNTNAESKNPILSASGVLGSGASMSIAIPNIKNENVLSFRGKITSFSTLRFSHGKTNAYSSAYFDIDSDNIKVYTITAQEDLLQTIPHGLTLDSFIDVTLSVGDDTQGKLVVSTSTGVFETTIKWQYGCRDNFEVASNGSILTDCYMSFYGNAYHKDIWLFGDSYFDFWNPYAIQYGANNAMYDAYSGRGSAVAYNSLSLALKLATPKTIVWCLGMNDGDSADSVNSTWLKYFEKVKEICQANSIEFIATTIPNTPTMNNTYKNQIIIESGCKYINIADAVGAYLDNVWYDGLMSTDNVHPNDMGSKVIAKRFITDLPTMIK